MPVARPRAAATVGVPQGDAPFWRTPAGDVRLWLGDVRACLARLPAESVNCCVTSPPYFGLRDYGIDGQLGNEPTPDAFVANMVAVFREVRRVLRDDGTLWLNLGDSYASGGGHTAQGANNQRKGRANVDAQNGVGQRNLSGLPSGNLVGIPWRVAFALQADGWTLRQDIIWSKPNAMPESVTNRCTKSHEYVFLLTKGPRYFYDAEAIKEKLLAPNNLTRTAENGMGNGELGASKPFGSPDPAGANRRSVWEIAVGSYPGAHFATFPPKLVEPCILAGTSAHGCCAVCGAPWRRIVAKERAESRVSGGGNCIGKQGHAATGTGAQQGANYRQIVAARTVGWEPTCGCGTDDVAPAVVLDPFAGSFTTGAVACRLGRAAWGIDLSERYLRDNAIPRVGAALIARDGGAAWQRGRMAAAVRMGAHGDVAEAE